VGLSPLTKIVTNPERHLLSLSNRDFAAHTHPAFADGFEDLVVGEFVTSFEGQGVEDDTTVMVRGQPVASRLDGIFDFAPTLPVLLAGCGRFWSLPPLWRLTNDRKQTKTDQKRPAETTCASPENPCVGGSIPLPGTTKPNKTNTFTGIQRECVFSSFGVHGLRWAKMGECVQSRPLKSP